MAESIENEIAIAEKKLNDAKNGLIEIKDRMIQEIEKALPTFLDNAISRLIEEQHETVINMPEENLRKLKEELRQVISENVARIASTLKASVEWFECGEYESTRSDGISLSSDLWRTIKSIAFPVAKTLEKYGIRVPAEPVFHGYRHITPINASYLGKTVEDLRSVLASAKTGYCKFKEERDSLVLKRKKELAKKKWEAL